jgi:hypothetical protein
MLYESEVKKMFEITGGISIGPDKTLLERVLKSMSQER